MQFCINYIQFYTKVYIGACLDQNGHKIGEIPNENGGWSGYYSADGGNPSGQVPTVGEGTAPVTIRPLIKETETSDEIEIFLNRRGYGETIIVSRRFPSIQNWEPKFCFVQEESVDSRPQLSYMNGWILPFRCVSRREIWQSLKLFMHLMACWQDDR